MIENITMAQWIQIKRYFNDNSKGFSRCRVSEAMNIIDVEFNNEWVRRAFSKIVAYTPNPDDPDEAWKRNLHTRSYTFSPLEMDIVFNLDSTSVDQDQLLAQLKENLQTFCKKVNSPLIPEQCKEIYDLLSKHNRFYDVITPENEMIQQANNAPANIQLKFKNTRGFEQFKRDVAKNWDIASYHYDDATCTVTLSMDNPQGFQKFKPAMLIQHLNEMNKNIIMTVEESQEIKSIFQARMGNMQIPVESRISSNDYRSLDMNISFKTEKQAKEFEKEVLPTLTNAFSITTSTSDKLERKLSITQYTGRGYDIALMSIDPAKSPAPTELFGIEPPFPSGFNPNKPTLIKYGDDYWIYGNSDGNHWKTQKFDPMMIQDYRINFSVVQELHDPQTRGICDYITSIQGHTHKESMNEILMTSFDHMEANLLDLLPESFCSNLKNALHRGMDEANIGYPQAVINVDQQQRPYVSLLTSKKRGEQFAWLDNPPSFQQFFDVFPQLCYKHKIDKHSGRQDFACRKELPNDLIKYEFYIPPESLHNLLMEESEFYRGYRSGASITDLANPIQTLIKKDVMCLFPVLPIDEGHLLIRNAGCNVSETLSTQLSFLAKENFPEVYGALSAYGHHTSRIVDKIGVRPDDLIQAALMCSGMNTHDIKKYGYHEAQDGLVPISLEQSHQDFLKKMDNSAKQIYSTSAVTPKELEQLHSFEVPMPYFLEKLIVVLQEREKMTETKDKSAIAQAIQNIHMLMSKITETAHITPQRAMSKDEQLHMKKVFQDLRQKTGTQEAPVPTPPKI